MKLFKDEEGSIHKIIEEDGTFKVVSEVYRLIPTKENGRMILKHDIKTEAEFYPFDSYDSALNSIKVFSKNLKEIQPETKQISNE